MKMNKKKALLSAALTIVLCISIIAGGTFALFTSSYTTSIAATSANVDVIAALDDTSLETKSLYEDWDDDLRPEGQFELGGTATLDKDNGVVTLTLLTPGDAARFKINVTNDSNVPVQYRVRTYSETVTAEDGTVLTDLTPALDISASMDHDGDAATADRSFKVSNSGSESATLWQVVGAGQDIGDITVTVDFPDREDNNDYKNAAAKIYFVLEAVQANGKVYDHQPATADDVATAVYGGGIINGDNKTIVLTEATYANNKHVKLVDVTLDGSAIPEMGVITNEYGDVTLGSDATIIAPTAANASAVFTLNYSPDIDQALTFENGSKVIVPAGGVAIQSMSSSASVNIYIDAADIFELADGAYFLYPQGDVVIKIYVPNETVFNAYINENTNILVNEGDGCAWTVQWFVGDEAEPRVVYDRTAHAFVEYENPENP